jgi:hypothetical protein
MNSLSCTLKNRKDLWQQSVTNWQQLTKLLRNSYKFKVHFLLNSMQEIQLKSLLALFTILHLGLAFAVEPTTPAVVTPTMTAQPATSTQKQMPGLKSFENRESKKFQLAIGMLGHEYIGTNAITLSAGYFLDPQSILLVRYSNLNGRGLDDDDSATLRAVTLGYRRFVANSFNLTPSVYYKRTTQKDNFTWFTTTSKTEVYEDIGIGFRIGNEWQWENFTLGCDWFGINRTMKVLNEKNVDDNWELFDTNSKYSFTIASFYLGYSF